MSFLPVGDPFPDHPSSRASRDDTPEPQNTSVPQSPDPNIHPDLLNLIAGAKKNASLSSRALTPLGNRTNQSFPTPELTEVDNGPSAGEKHPRPDDDIPNHPRYSPAPGAPNPNLIALGKRMMGIKRLRRENQALFEEWLRSSREEREVINTALQFWTYEATAVQAEEWKVDGTLEKTIKRYSQAYVFAPAITSYKVGAPSQVMALLKRTHPALMPPDTEPIRLEKVAQVIKRDLTNARSHLKLTIKTAIERHEAPATSTVTKSKTDKAADVATVCAALLKKGGPQIQFTTQHYARVAFIRWALDKYPSIQEAQFWAKVDENLSDLRNQLKPDELHQAFKQILVADTEKYGSPAHHKHPLKTAKDLEAWQIQCERAAEKAIETAGVEADSI